MRISAAFLFLASTVSGFCAPTDDGIEPQSFERYATMAAKSPFALATTTVAPEAPQASFAANWYVAGIGRFGEVYFVTIKSRDATQIFSVFGQETHSGTGVSVTGIDWSETLGKTTVTVRKGTEVAKLEFNEAEVRGGASRAEGVPNPSVASAPNPGGVMVTQLPATKGAPRVGGNGTGPGATAQQISRAQATAVTTIPQAAPPLSPNGVPVGAWARRVRVPAATGPR